jgi:hypothetical protein
MKFSSFAVIEVFLILMLSSRDAKLSSWAVAEMIAVVVVAVELTTVVVVATQIAAVVVVMTPVAAVAVAAT